MSKGGSTTSNTEIPAYLEDAVKENINRAQDVSKIGYVPYYGPDVAAFNPMQESSFRATGSAADAFGLGPASTVPNGASFGAHSPTWATDGIQAPTTFAGGMRGYSSAPLFEQSVDSLRTNRPGQYNALADMFIDPFTGAAGTTTPVVPPIVDPPYVPPIVDNTYVPPIVDNTVLIDLIGSQGDTTFTSEEISNANDNIYTQATSIDLIGGDTFIGNDGNTYTVGYGDGEVDPGLANAAVNSNGIQVTSLSNDDAAPFVEQSLWDILSAADFSPDTPSQQYMIDNGLVGASSVWTTSDGSPVVSNNGNAVKTGNAVNQSGSVSSSGGADTGLLNSIDSTSNGVNVTGPVMTGLLADQLTSEYDLQTGLRDEKLAQTNSAVQNMYTSILDRDADPEGLAYWSDEINSGRKKPEEVAAAINWHKNEDQKKAEIDAWIAGSNDRQGSGGGGGFTGGGGGGTSSSAMGTGTAKRGFNFGL